MQVGINSNIHHQSKVLHVQTEDSGYEHGHIITHIFLAGSIIASQKLEYTPDCDEVRIQELIKSQHQNIITALKSGQFDKKILLNRAQRPQGAIPLARKKNQIPLKSKALTVNTDSENTSKPNSASSTTGNLSDHKLTGLNLKSDGIWALPKFHREQNQLNHKKNAMRDQDSDEEGSS